MIIKYEINEKVKDKVSLLLKQERNLVVKERLTMVSMFVNGMLKKDIINITCKSKDTVGRWITAYFKGGIKALQDNRGGANNSYLSNKNKQELKNIIINTYPIVFKGETYQKCCVRIIT
jgi:transposase